MKEKGKLIESPQYPLDVDGLSETAEEWAKDDRLWTTQETVAFNLKTFARKILSLREAESPRQPSELDKELGRWQKAIYELCKKAVGTDGDFIIDGGGCDSGDALDFTLTEIGQAFSNLREFSQHPEPAPLYRPSEDLRKAFADSIVDILWDRRELDSRNNTRQKCVDIVMSAFAQYGKVVRSEGEHPGPAKGGQQ